MKTLAVIKLVKILQIQHRETGQKARDERKKRGISLRAVARHTKLSAPYISDLERGRRNWNLHTIRDYEFALEALTRNQGSET